MELNSSEELERTSSLKLKIKIRSWQAKKPATVHLNLLQYISTCLILLLFTYILPLAECTWPRSKGVPTQVPVSKAQDEERGKENPTARLVNVHESQIGR